MSDERSAIKAKRARLVVAVLLLCISALLNVESGAQSGKVVHWVGFGLAASLATYNAWLLYKLRRERRRSR